MKEKIMQSKDWDNLRFALQTLEDTAVMWIRDNQYTYSQEGCVITGGNGSWI